MTTGNTCNEKYLYKGEVIRRKENQAVNSREAAYQTHSMTGAYQTTTCTKRLE